MFILKKIQVDEIQTLTSFDFCEPFWRVMLKNSKGFKEISLDEKATWTTQRENFPLQTEKHPKINKHIYSLENSAALG